MNPLESKIKQHQADVKVLAEKEALLARSIYSLQQRWGYVQLTELQQAIQQARAELDQLSCQLGEKRSLLDRMLHRKGGAG